MAFRLPLDKASAWAESRREAAPATASEVPPPCPQVILGEAAKSRIPMLTPGSYPVPHPPCPARTLHRAFRTQPGHSYLWAEGHSPPGSPRQVWSCDTSWCHQHQQWGTQTWGPQCP